MNKDTLLALSPWIEVLVKTIYWRSALIHRFLSRPRRPKAVPAVATAPAAVPAIDFADVMAALEGLGAKPGEIMILHSSGAALKPTGLAPRQICERLSAFLGPEGTLAVPAIPLFADEPTGPARLGDEVCGRVTTYDVARTPTWTGAIPKALLGMAGAVRSRHPLNTMAAIGRDAQAMMAGNLEGEQPTACGPVSSWKFCADRNARIVCLGVDTAHSLTMIHVAEDSWERDWPIDHWYRTRPFLIRDGDFEREILVRERHPRWAINYGERTLQRDLIRCGILKVSYVGSLRIECCESASLIDFLNQRKQRGYPYWVPFWVKRKR